jgi:hypothetical protein
MRDSAPRITVLALLTAITLAWCMAVFNLAWRESFDGYSLRETRGYPWTYVARFQNVRVAREWSYSMVSPNWLAADVCAALVLAFAGGIFVSRLQFLGRRLKAARTPISDDDADAIVSNLRALRARTKTAASSDGESSAETFEEKS